MKITPLDLDKLGFSRVQEALSNRTSTFRGRERALKLAPLKDHRGIEKALDQIEEVVTGEPISLGGVSDIRPLISRVVDGGVLDGPEILEVSYTMAAAGTIRRSILASERTSLAELAIRLETFDRPLKLVGEMLTREGKVSDNATPKIRDIRQRLNPLRDLIKQRLQSLLSTYSSHIQDAIITLRRGRYVIPLKSSSQSHVPGIVLDLSDSGSTVFIEPASLPACGSVRPNADSISPEAIFGKYFSFKLLLPNKRRGKVPSDVCAAIVIATEASAFANSIIAVA